MKRQEVKGSSQIAAIGYDKKSKVLEVEFHKGGVYQYAGVSGALYEYLINAPSVGGYFAAHIKKHPEMYPCTKIGEVKEKEQWQNESVKEVHKHLREEPAHEQVAIDKKVKDIVSQADALVVRDNDEYVAAAEFLKNVKALQGEVASAFDPIISKAHEAHKVALEQKRKANEPLLKAEGVVKKLIVGYLKEQEEERLKEEQRIRDEHERTIRRQADEDNLKRAQELMEQGDMEGAAEAVDAEVEVPSIPVHVESSVPRVSGISKRVLYVVKEVRLMELVKAVASGLAPLECVKSNDVFLNAQARAYKKGDGELFPGVVVGTDDNLAASGK